MTFHFPTSGHGHQHKPERLPSDFPLPPGSDGTGKEYDDILKLFREPLDLNEEPPLVMASAATFVMAMATCDDLDALAAIVFDSHERQNLNHMFGGSEDDIAAVLLALAVSMMGISLGIKAPTAAKLGIECHRHAKALAPIIKERMGNG